MFFSKLLLAVLDILHVPGHLLVRIRFCWKLGPDHGNIGLDLLGQLLQGRVSHFGCKQSQTLFIQYMHSPMNYTKIGETG